MKQTSIFLAALLGLVIPVAAQQYGFSVTTHWNGTNDNLYGGWGEIWRHNINTSYQVSGSVKLYDGPAAFPTISPDGIQVAFVKSNGDVCVMPAGGGSVEVLASAGSGKAYLGWPTGRYLYYSKGGYGENGSKELWRVNVDTKAASSVHTFNTQMWLWSMALDADKMAVRPCDGQDGGGTGHVYRYQLSSSYTIAQGHANDFGMGCGNAISPNGNTIMRFDNYDHNHIVFQNFSNKSQTAELWVNTANSWGSNQGNSWNRNRWSANSNDWICTMQGDNRGQNGSNQVLYNVSAQRQIVASASKTTSYACAGSFWVGTVVQDPVINLSPASLAFDCVEGGNPLPASKTVTVSNSGGGSLGTISASESADWLSVSVSGATITNTVSATSLSAGNHSATVTVSATGAAQDKTYEVALTVRGAPVFTSVTVTPAYANASSGGTAQFAASARDQFGDPLSPQPSFSWSVSGGGSISQTGLFTAGTTEGSFTVTATATVGEVTHSGTAQVTVSDYLFFDDFEDGNADGWTVVNGNWSVSGGGYVNTGASGQNSVVTAGSVSWTDYVYEVDVRPTQGTGQWVIFRAQANGDFYLFQLSDRKVYKKVGGNFTEIATATGGSFTTNTTYRIRVAVAGNAITVSSDGSQILSTTDNTFASGAIGLGGWESSARFDNVTVIDPNAGGPPLVVTAPAPGALFEPGQTMTITWITNKSSIANVYLQISADNGVDWRTISGVAAIENTGSFSWLIPANGLVDGMDIRTNQCIVKVADPYGQLDEAVSGLFTIGGSSVAGPGVAAVAAVPMVSFATGTGMLQLAIPAGVRAEIFTMNGVLVWSAPASLQPVFCSVPTAAVGKGLFLVKMQGAEGKGLSRAVVLY